jgi:hypothetical protein
MKLAISMGKIDDVHVGNFADARLKKREQNFIVGCYQSKRFAYESCQEIERGKSSSVAG